MYVKETSTIDGRFQEAVGTIIGDAIIRNSDTRGVTAASLGSWNVLVAGDHTIAEGSHSERRQIVVKDFNTAANVVLNTRIVRNIERPVRNRTRPHWLVSNRNVRTRDDALSSSRTCKDCGRTY